MGRVRETSLLGKKEILKFGTHSIQISITVDDIGVQANSEGRKIVQAGTILGGNGGSILEDDTIKAIKKNTQSERNIENGEITKRENGLDAEGVLLNDVDVTYGPTDGTMVIHGFINLNSIPEAPCKDSEQALKNITFMV